MGFDRFSKAASEKKAARAATEPPNPSPTEFKTMMGETTGATKTATLAPEPSKTRAIALGGIKANVLAKIASDDHKEGGGFSELFPTLVLTGGNGGGQMIPSGGTAHSFKEIAGKLPQGKQVVEGVFMGVRAEAIAWPGDFDKREENERPTMSAAIRLDDGDNLGKLLTGSENFQFCPKDQKDSKWAAAAGGPGFLRPVFQVLIWLPQLQTPVVLQASPLLKTFREMAGQMSQFLDGETGEISPVPVRFEPTSDIWYDKNLYHYWKSGLWTDAQGKQAYSAYAEWAKSVVENRPDVVQAVNDWCTGADKPLNDEGIARLTWAASAVNPRRRG